MKNNNKKDYHFLTPQEVLTQIKLVVSQSPDETLAEEATGFYSEELFNFDLERIGKIEIDLSEFKSEI